MLYYSHMTEANKCFCDLYRGCADGSVSEVSVWTDKTITPGEFIEDVDKICPGTRVFVAATALSASKVIVDNDTVTLPRNAVTLQCEYFITRHPGM